MAYFFVSYSHDDRRIAEQLRRALETEQHDVFIDSRALRIGDDWRVRLVDELRAADAVLPIITPRFSSSSWCVAEVAVAKVLGSRILPLACGGGDPSTVPFLEELHYLQWAHDLIPGSADAPSPSPGAGPVSTEQLMEALGAHDRRWPAGGPPVRYAAWLLGERPAETSPFPGLAYFRSSMWWAFFGRETDTRRVVERLRADDVHARGLPVFLVGPSGCGKSSLARAGVLPRMLSEPGWSAVRAVVAGRDPVASLCVVLAEAGRLVGLDWSADDVERRVRGRSPPGADPGAGPGAGLRAVVTELLGQNPAGHRDRLLVVLDQVEETLSQGDAAAREALGLLVRMARDSQVRLIGTLRSEYLDELIRLPDLQDAQPYLVSPLDAAALREVIRAPAGRAGIRVSAELVERLVADTGDGEALPLLAFVLNQLADGVRRGEALDVRRYEAIGKVEDALSRQADDALDARTRRTRRTSAQVLASLLELVVVNDDRSPVRRRRVWDELAEPTRADLDAFEERRLLTKSVHGGTTYVTVTHEAFLTGWNPLAAAISGQEALLMSREKILRAATEWEESGHDRSLLWSFDRITSAVLPANEPRVLITHTSWPARIAFTLRRALGAKPHLPATFARVGRDRGAVAFLAASYQRGRIRRYRWIGLLAVLGLSLSATAGWARVSQVRAHAERCEARSQELIQTAQTLRESRPLTALQLSIVAYQADCAARAATDNLISVQDLTYSRYLGDLGTTIHAAAADSHSDRLALATEDDGVALVDLRSDLRTSVTFSVPVYAVEFSPDGQRLAVGGADGRVEVWDVDARRRLVAFAPSREPVNAVAFSPDGRTVATGGQDGLVRLWDADTGTERRAAMRDNGQPVNALAFAPGGERVAAAGADGDLDVWDPTTGALVGSLSGHTGPVRTVAYGPDGVLASGADDTSIRIWDVAAGRAKTVMIGHFDKVRALTFSPDGSTLASGAQDATIRLWDTASGQPLRTLAGPPAPVTGVMFSRDGLAVRGVSLDAKLGEWDVGYSGADNPFGMSTLAMHPRDADIVATSAPGRPTTLWDMTRRTAPIVLDPQPDLVGDDAGVDLATAPSGMDAALTATGTGVEPVSPGPDVTSGLSFSADGGLLAAPLGDDVGVWRTDDGTLAHRLTGHTGPVFAVAFSPDGRHLASAGQDATVRIWDPSDLAAGSRVALRHFGPVRAVAFSRDGTQLASAGDDSTINHVRFGPDGKVGPVVSEVYHLPPVETVAFSPDGRLLAAGSQDRLVSLWRTDDGRGSPDVLPAHRQGVVSVTFDPDGERLASIAADGEIRVRDLRTDTDELGVRTRDGASSLSFTPDGDHLITTSRAGMPRVWTLRADDIARRVCGLGVFAADREWERYVTDLSFRSPCR